MTADGQQAETGTVLAAIGGRTATGRQRRENQDDFLVADLGGGVVLRADEDPQAGWRGELLVDTRGTLLTVADGMGGAAAGSLASRLTTLWLHQEMLSLWSGASMRSLDTFAATLRAAVERTSQRVHAQAMNDPDLHGMGSTVTAAGVLGGHACLAQVGDSRGYLLRAGECHQLTRDQSMVQALVDAGTMTEAEAEASDRRNVILQAIGTTARVKVELSHVQLRRGDTLLLCSDGLSRMITRAEFAALAVESHHPQQLCDALVALADERGGPDNITAVMAHFSGEGLQPPEPGEPVVRNGHGAPAQ